MSAHPDIQRVTTDDGVAIAYQTVGNGPCPLLALHGWGGAGTGHAWRAVIEHLDLKRFRLIAVDLRGHGASDKPEHGYTLDRFSRDILAVADHAQAQTFALLASSMSARFAQWIACGYPDRVLGLILLAPVPAVALSLGNEMIESWIRETRHLETFGGFLRQFAGGRLSDDSMAGYFDDLSRASEFAKTETLRMCSRESFSDRIGAIRAPTLVVAGDDDPMLPPQLLLAEVAGRIPNAELVRLDGGHAIALEHPDRVAALIEVFLTGACL